MNKTVKTIAWICLVLGLLGLAVDAGAFIYGRRMAAQMRAALAAGGYPAFGERFRDDFGESGKDGFRGRFGDADEDGDVDEDDLQMWRSEHDGQIPFGGMPGIGMRGGFAPSSNRASFARDMHCRSIGRGFGFLFFVLVAGPVLTVIGAVMLIVNRAPKTTDEKGKKSKSKKT